MSFGPQPISKTVISWAQYEAHGCPECKTGTKTGYPLIQGPGFALIVCANCGVAYEINDEKAKLS